MSQNFTDNFYGSANVVDTDMTKANANFGVLKSSFSGATAPSDLIAGMWWFDTTSNILKVRNEANSAWQSVWNLADNKPVITNLSNEITGAMVNSATKDPVGTTAGLRTLGDGANQACAGNDSRILSLATVVGDQVVGRDDVSRTKSNDGSYSLAKYFTIPIAGAYRISFELSGSGASHYGYAILYKNSYEPANVMGVEKSVSGYGFESKTQDLSDWAVGDSCMLYYKTHSESMGTVYVKNFRLSVATARIGASAGPV